MGRPPGSKMPRLHDKVCIVTGAGAGIGRASAELFAREGAKVVCADLSPATGEATVSRIRGSGGQAHFVPADVTRQEDVERMVQVAVDTYGRLDVLFNNAGIVPVGTALETSPEDWDAAMAANVSSVYLGCRAALPVMLRQGAGVILNTASVAGLMGVENRGAYSASKGAVIALTRSLAKDFVSHGIRVNCLCPGTVDTPSWRGRVNAAPDPKAALAAMVARQPMGRVGRPEEIALAALYLCSDESAYITGISLVIDGGMSL